MKLQHLSIIFIIIVVPISLVLSTYIYNYIRAIDYQTEYNDRLIDATYDAIKAFQLNTSNNTYSTLGNSKIRDIEAAISTYFDSLATNFSGYSAEELKEYTPAILLNLYDGYYIYSKYFDTEIGDYTFGLKPFMYYSCRYINGSNYDFVVNYTLDNTITVIGKVNGRYTTKTGYLINIDDIPWQLRTRLQSASSWEDIEDILNNDDTLNNYKEILQESILITDNANPEPQEYQYIVYNSQKIYKENGINDSTDPNKRYFYYSSSNSKDYINSTETIEYLNKHLDSSFNFYSYSAIQYYYEALEFTTWVNSNLGNITQKHAVDSEGTTITNFSTDTGNEAIFKTSNTNNPLQSGSIFDENRISVIRRSIETNLIVAIDTFSSHSKTEYEFVMPNLSEENWYNIENNIAIVTFLQGLPIGAKIYNSYCAVSNNTNQEMVGTNSLYIKDSTGEYHKPGCKSLIEKLGDGSATISGIYSSADFQRRSVSLTGSDANAHSQLTGANSGTYGYYYPQTGTACYDCIVTVSNAYSVNDIIGGSVTDTNGRTINFTNLHGTNLKEAYLTALARIRYNLYVTNSYFGYSND